MIEIIYILMILLYLIALVSKHDRDACRTNYKKTIVYQLFPNWTHDNLSYVTENLWIQDSWWIKNVITWKIDYWHRMEVGMVGSFIGVLVVVIFLMNQTFFTGWWSLLLIPIYVVLYAIFGGVHSLLDGSLLRKFKK